MAGVLLFLLPAAPARAFGALLYVVCLLALGRRARLAWITFGASTILIGATIYGFSIPGDAPATWWRLRFGTDGALVGAQEMLRVLGLFSLGMLASRWISPDDLMPLVASRPLPLYVAASMLRLVPAIREDVERIRRVQRARGLEPGRMWTRPVRMLPIIVPVFVNALRRAREQALALELAGLGRRNA